MADEELELTTARLEVPHDSVDAAPAPTAAMATADAPGTPGAGSAEKPPVETAIAPGKAAATVTPPAAGEGASKDAAQQTPAEEPAPEPVPLSELLQFLPKWARTLYYLCASEGATKDLFCPLVINHPCSAAFGTFVKGACWPMWSLLFGLAISAFGAGSDPGSLSSPSLNRKAPIM